MDGGEPQPDHLYLAPSDRLLTFADGRFHLRPVDQPASERGAIDSFMSSLAEAHGRAAVGVLMVGMGAEGTAGVTALKASGGLLVCERDDARGVDELHPLADPSGRIVSSSRAAGTSRGLAASTTASGHRWQRR